MKNIKNLKKRMISKTFMIIISLLSADAFFQKRKTYTEFCEEMDLDCDHSHKCFAQSPHDIHQSSILTDTLRKRITQDHNYYRNIMACGEIMNIKGERLPKAAKMHELTWDPELERLSEISAKECKNGTWNKICKFSENFEVNSIAQSGSFWKGKKDESAEEEIKKKVRFWFNQYHKTSFFSLTEVFDRAIDRKFNTQIVGELKRLGMSIDILKYHSVEEFLNMMFDDIDRIGCALYNCPSGAGIMYSFVCSYNQRRRKERPVSIVVAKTLPAGGCKSTSPKYCCLCRNSSVGLEGLESGPCDKYEDFIRPFFNIVPIYNYPKMPKNKVLPRLTKENLFIY